MNKDKVINLNNRINEDLHGKVVDKVARDIIAEAGYGAYFGHGLGHSVGLFIHEVKEGNFEEDILGPCRSSGSGFYSAVPSRCNSSLRRSCISSVKT